MVASKKSVSGLVLGALLVFAFLFVISSFGSAFLYARADGNTTLIAPLEDRYYIYNITVNNTDTPAGNVSMVNITIPSGFTFVTASNITSAIDGHNFTNMTNATRAITILSWFNSTGIAGTVLIGNISTQWFTFNASVATAGWYNITVDVLNATGWYSLSNLSVHINETVLPFSARAPVNTTLFAPLEDRYFMYNVTLNNSNTYNDAADNITQVNITVPSSFTFVTASNITAAVDVNFTNMTDSTRVITILSWKNSTGGINSTVVGNITSQYFMFNLSQATAGWYNITVDVLNATGWYSLSNITISVNETGLPFFARSLANTTLFYRLEDVSHNYTLSINNSNVYNDAADNITQVNVTIPSTFTLVSGSNISWNYTGTVSYSNFTNMTNATRGITILSWFNTSGVLGERLIGNISAQWFSFNASQATPGVYNFTVDVLNDTGWNRLSNITVQVNDTTAPSSVTFSCTPTNVGVGSVVSCTCSAVDAFDASPNVTYTASPSTVAAGTFSTSCVATDDAGNSLTSSSVSYVVESGSAAAATGSSGGGATPATTQVTWTTTKTVTVDELAAGVVQTLGPSERTQFSVGGTSHHAGVVNVTATTAIIQIASTPQEVTLSIGESKKFELTLDTYYDVVVTLVSIANGKANVTIQSIHEAMPVPPAAPVTPEALVDETTSPAAEASTEVGMSSSTVWTIVAVVVIVIVLIIWAMRRGKKYK